MTPTITGIWGAPGTFARYLQERVNESDPALCWKWGGPIDVQGYGVAWFNEEKRLQKAHRAVYELLVGPIPEHLQCDHLCRNRACVNPNHIDLVTQAENVRRGLSSALRPHCKHDSYYRQCVECHREQHQNRRATAKALGQCRDCNEPAMPNRIRCEVHLKAHAAKELLRWQTKKAGMS